MQAASKLKPTSDSDQIRLLTTLDQVVQVLRSDARFNGFQVEVPEHETVRLLRDGVIYFLFGPSWWENREKIEGFLQNPDMRGVCSICVGTEEELARLPAGLRHAEVQLLALPLPPAGLHGYLHSLHNVTTLMHNATVERERLETTNEQVKYVLSVSRELNGVRDITKLLSLILSQAREVTGADAGSIYVVESGVSGDKGHGTLNFKIAQNHSMPQTLTEIRLPIDENSVVGSAALHGTVINIPDLYHANQAGPRVVHDQRWDRTTGYQCRSMLTVPMFDISHKVIGVIQLINRKREPQTKLLLPLDFEEKILAFDGRDEEYAQIVAQQAGIALENAILTTDIQKVFEGFVEAAVSAIEQRDPTTSGHSFRVAKLTCGLAESVDRCPSGIYRDTHFTTEQMKEIEYASLLHDFGKLGVRENVLVKAKKLYPWQMDLLLERFELAKASYEIDYLKRCLKYLLAPGVVPAGMSADELQLERDGRMKELEDFLNFILKANEPTVLPQGGFERLKDIAELKFCDTHGRHRPLLHSEELLALSVNRGSLTAAEFNEIQSHVTHTYNFLRKIPWGKSLSNIPEIALKHHEKLDGSGYPTAATAEQIPVQSRMMTIADIYDALTASDRPYKKAVPADRALEILEMEVKSGKMDSELLKIFIETGVYRKVEG